MISKISSALKKSQKHNFYFHSKKNHTAIDIKKLIHDAVLIPSPKHFPTDGGGNGALQYEINNEYMCRLMNTSAEILCILKKCSLIVSKR